MHDGALQGLFSGLRRARITAVGPDGRPEVEYPGEAPRGAETLVALRPADIGAEAAVGLMDGEPVVIGLLRRTPAPDAIIDGERVTLEGRREVVLRCGKASLTLTADGRVTIRGTQVLSRAEGANRVQGASVQLN